MKRNICLVLAMLICSVGSLHAESILWASGSSDFDQGFVDILENEGYTVDRLAGAAEMTQAKVDQANTYDLVIVGRDVISGDYVNGDEADLWNSIAAPMINMSAYLWRNNRWDWVTSGSTFNSSYPVVIELSEEDPMYAELLNGIELDENDSFRLVTNNTTIVPIASVGNGKLIGRRGLDTEPWVWVAYWQSGQEFYPGGPVVAGDRMAFGAGDANDSVRGAMNLTDADVTLLLNAVYMMSGATFDRPPFVSAGNAIAEAGEVIELDATAYDPDSEVSVVWSQLSGPTTAQIDDATSLTINATFPVKGVYTLNVTVSDGTTTVSDEMKVYVRDSADNALIAHWNFDGISGDILPDVSGNGFNGTFYRPDDRDPNLVEGNMIPIPSDAADLRTGDKYWEIENSYRSQDPNFNDLQTGMSVAAWVNIEDASVAAPMIIGNGLDGWRFLVYNNMFNIACEEVGINLFAEGINAYDGKWHHVVASYDGVAAEARIYVDGQFINSQTTERGSLFIKGEDYPMIEIGNRGDADRPWKGLIDDLRVYNYPITESEIDTLAAAGDRVVLVSAGEDEVVNFKGAAIDLGGELLVDDGVPVAATVAWTVVSVPDGVVPTDVVFADAISPATAVTLPKVEGRYTLRITADDTVSASFDEVVIDLQVPVCADVIADGLGLASDISGPEGVADCYVDLHDFAALAADWLSCNNPIDASCDWAYQN